jgi:hypothetical protein
VHGQLRFYGFYRFYGFCRFYRFYRFEPENTELETGAGRGAISRDS